MNNNTISQLNAIIKLHEKMKGSYFYNSPMNASSRRSYEQHNSLETTITHNNQEVRVEQNTQCSCKNVYYKMSIYINGNITTKNISFVKKLLKECESKSLVNV